MKSKFLTEPALLLEPDKILIVSDLHIGIEREIKDSGITIPSQIEKMRKRINDMINQTKAKHLIILGDVKHHIPNISWQEFKEIPDFLKYFSDKLKISIVKGNHDGEIERLAPKEIDIYEPKGFRIKNFGFAHGQAWFDKKLLECEYLIIAHAHPAIEFLTENFRSLEPCWLKCQINHKKIKEKYKKESKLKYGIIMPAFNHLIGGMAFNSKDFEPIGPILKNDILKWKEGKVYLLDGTYLGNLKNLKNKK